MLNVRLVCLVDSLIRWPFLLYSPLPLLDWLHPLYYYHATYVRRETDSKKIDPIHTFSFLNQDLYPSDSLNDLAMMDCLDGFALGACYIFRIHTIL